MSQMEFPWQRTPHGKEEEFGHKFLKGIIITEG